MDCQCVINSRRWQSVMEEDDKGYSKFCVTFVTATRTAGILIHSRLKVLAVNLSWPSGRLFCMLASLGLTTLDGSKQTCCLCESFFFFLMGVSGFLLVPAHLGSPR